MRAFAREEFERSRAETQEEKIRYLLGRGREEVGRWEGYLP